MKFIWFFIPLLLVASEVFYDKNISTYSLSKKYSFANFSYTESLSYIDTNKTFINNYQKPFITNYKTIKPKEEVLNMIDTSTFGGNLYNDVKINIFSSTNQTLTLENINSAYTGGAHGHYYVEFQNFYRNIPIKLKDIISNYARLVIIAKKYYKFINLMKQNQSLLDDGWFEDKFILPQQFALTNRGILFYYNSYEIKPYAFGDTKFILPYYKIKNILKLKFPYKPIVLQNEFGKITITSNKNNINFKIKNFYYTDKEKIFIKLYNYKTITKIYKNLEYDNIKTITIKKPKKEVIIDIKVRFDNNSMPKDRDEIPTYNTKDGLVYRISIL
jgi:hypothetical protein